MLGFYQVVSRLASVYDVPMPDAVRNLLAVFEVLNISIAGVGLPLQCLSLGTYEQQLFFTMLAPLVLAAALVLVFVLRSCFGKRGGPKAGLLAALPSLLTISFLVFPVVSSASWFKAVPTLHQDSCLWRRLASLKARGWPTQPQAAPRQRKSLRRLREGCWRADSTGPSPF